MDFDSVVLADDEILVLRSKAPLTSQQISDMNFNLPPALRGRVIVVDQDVDVFVVRQL